MTLTSYPKSCWWKNEGQGTRCSLTPLLKWYSGHGLHVAKIYQVIESSPCFQDFRESVSDANIKEDENPEKLFLGDTLLGEIKSKYYV